MAGVTLVTGHTNYRQDVLLVMRCVLCSIQNAVNSVECSGVMSIVKDNLQCSVIMVQCAV